MVQISIQTIQLLSTVLIQLAQATPAINAIATPQAARRFLERRQISCPTSNPVSCQTVDPKLPSDFCCPTGTDCISLDSSSSALCCPAGSSCARIETIACNVTFEDPTKFPAGPIFTTRLTDTLSQCPGSNKCCPFGYTCGTASDGSAVCQIVASKAITQSANTSTSPSSSTSGPNSPSATSASSQGIDSTAPQAANSSSSSNPFPPTVFLAGFFPGVLVGALGVLAWVILTGRHKKSDDNASATSSIYRKKMHISGPVPVDVRNTRTDFLRRGKSLFYKRSTDGGTPGLPFDNWKMPTPPEPNNIPERPIGEQIAAGPGAKPVPSNAGHPGMTQYPVTPKRQIYGQVDEPGTETIRVYSPRDMEIPSATVAPLRGMHSRDRSRGSGGGGTFVIPSRPQDVLTHAPPSQPSQYPYESAYQTRYETLSPVRYDGGSSQNQRRGENLGQQKRPETSFTAMLQEINFPDPMNQQNPQVPEIPRQYRR